MDVTAFLAPSVSFSFHHDDHNGHRPAVSIGIKGSMKYGVRRALREASTRRIRDFLLLLNEEHGIANIELEEVYLEPASVFALKQCLRRHATRHRHGCKVTFKSCYGAFELALCTVLKRNCGRVTILRQHLKFTPKLVDALSNSRSLRYLAIGNDSLEETDMKLLALCLCQNQYIKTLFLGKAFQGDASIVAFASCMRGMTSLCRMRLLVGNEFGILGEQALFQVLEEADTSLDQLLLQGKPDHVQDHIDFLLRLKQKGGRSYIGTCTTHTNKDNPNQWIDLLEEFKDDTNALYYILSADPGRI
jgi:hypothetical protein